MEKCTDLTQKAVKHLKNQLKKGPQRKTKIIWIIKTMISFTKTNMVNKFNLRISITKTSNTITMMISVRIVSTLQWTLPSFRTQSTLDKALKPIRVRVLITSNLDLLKMDLHPISDKVSLRSTITMILEMKVLLFWKTSQLLVKTLKFLKLWRKRALRMSCLAKTIELIMMSKTIWVLVHLLLQFCLLFLKIHWKMLHNLITIILRILDKGP